MQHRNLNSHHSNDNEEYKPLHNSTTRSMHSPLSQEEDGSPSKLFPKPGSDEHEHPVGHGAVFYSFVNGSRRPLIYAAAMVLAVFFVGFKTGEHSVPKQGTKEYEKFLIFAQQRSGSKFLTSLMNNHPQISCGNEELLHLIPPPGDDALAGFDIDMYMKMVTGTFTQLVEGHALHSPNSMAHVDTVTHVGFKIMYDQGLLQFQDQLLAKCDELGIKVIHLVRRNKLLQYVSYASNKKDRLENADGHVPHPTTEAEIKALAEIRVPGKPDKVLKYLDRKNNDVKEMSNILAKYLEQPSLSTVNYEDLSADNDGEMARLFKFLDVKVQKVTTDLAKIHKDKKIHEYFEEEDQDALRDALKESEFAWILENW